MKKIIQLIIIVSCLSLSLKAQEIELEKFLEKANEATVEYRETFKNLIAEELKIYEYFRKDGSLDETRRIKSIFVVYQSPKNSNLIYEFRNVIEFNGKNVAREDEDVNKFFEKLAKADSGDEEYERLRKEGNRFEGRSQTYGLTLSEGFVLHRFYRPFFEFKIVGKEKIEGRETLIVEYKQTKPTARIRVNATDEELKQEPNGIRFDTNLPDKFRPTNPRLQGRLWLDAETAQLWRNEFTVTIQPANFSNAVVSSNFLYEYQSSEFGVLLPKTFSMTHYRFSGKNETDLLKIKFGTKTFEYSKFSKSSAEVKETKTVKP